MGPRLLAHLAEGRSVAYASDAGTPLIADPGYRLATEAIAAGHPVRAAPGASAVLAALAVAGLPTDRFLFAGFLPPKAAARARAIAELAAVPATLVLYEAPGRTPDTLAALAEGLGDRPAALCRELTKLHEEVVRAPLSDLAQRPAPRGEVVLVVGPPEARAGRRAISRAVRPCRTSSGPPRCGRSSTPGAIRAFGLRELLRIAQLHALQRAHDVAQGFPQVGHAALPAPPILARRI